MDSRMHSTVSDDYRQYISEIQDNHFKPPPSKFAIFCEASSVRGMQKIHKSKTKFLKALWIGFVFFMSILLIIISTNLVIDFRNYHTAWHISTELDEKTRFPAISICSHNPFSTEANALWKEGKVLTPATFRKRLFEAEVGIIKSGNHPGISLLDKADEYYGNIDYPTSVGLGHKRNILKYCVVLNEGFTVIAEDCLVENETGLTVTQFSHYNYFNCFTIEAKTENRSHGDGTNDTVSLILIINVNLFSDLYQANESFIMDSLTRGEGLRLVIHQVGTYPDIDKSGINIQPGKMNEITFQNVHWTSYNSPKKECRDNQPPIVDLDRVYDYTFTKCLDAELNKMLIAKCKCMSTIWPRPQAPTKEIPYCNDYSGNLKEITTRINCAVEEVLEKLKSLKTYAAGRKCWPVCVYDTYESTLSITRWTSSLHKLHRITKRYRSVNKFIDDIKNVNPNNVSVLNQLKTDYFDELYKDLNYKSSTSQDKNEVILNEQQMNYVNIVRQNFETTKRIEKLFIDIYIFIARVGGLCSLCIGLTTAFFIEIIEFLYLCIFPVKLQSNERPKNSNNLGSESNFKKLRQQSSPLFTNQYCESYLKKNKYHWQDLDPICQCSPIKSSLLTSQLNDSVS